MKKTTIYEVYFPGNWDTSIGFYFDKKLAEKAIEDNKRPANLVQPKIRGVIVFGEKDEKTN